MIPSAAAVRAGVERGDPTFSSCAPNGAALTQMGAGTIGTPNTPVAVAQAEKPASRPLMLEPYEETG